METVHNLCTTYIRPCYTQRRVIEGGTSPIPVKGTRHKPSSFLVGRVGARPCRTEVGGVLRAGPYAAPGGRCCVGRSSSSFVGRGAVRLGLLAVRFRGGGTIAIRGSRGDRGGSGVVLTPNSTSLPAQTISAEVYAAASQKNIVIQKFTLQ